MRPSNPHSRRFEWTNPQKLCRTRDFLVTKKKGFPLIWWSWVGDKVSFFPRGKGGASQTNKKLLKQRLEVFNLWKTRQKKRTGHINTTSGQLRYVALGIDFWVIQNTLRYERCKMYHEGFRWPSEIRVRGWKKEQHTPKKMLLNQKLVVKDLQNKTSCRCHLRTSDFCGESGSLMIWDIFVGKNIQKKLKEQK